MKLSKNAGTWSKRDRRERPHGEQAWSRSIGFDINRHVCETHLATSIHVSLARLPAIWLMPRSTVATTEWYDAGVRPAALYEKYHRSRNDERRGLFETVRSEFGPESGLYPGCFVHITPSFVFAQMTYVDSDRNAARFFASDAPSKLISENVAEDAAHRFSFFAQDYRDPVPVADESVDLLVSQYGGFVSEVCTRYLAPGGYLVANNSHGDAGVAACSDHYRLVGVVDRRDDRWALRTTDLASYFEPKSTKVPRDPTELRDHILKLGRGIGYTKTATDYVFQKL